MALQKCKSGFYAIISVFFLIGKRKSIIKGLNYAPKKKKKQPKVTKKEKENNYIQEGSESTNNNYIQE